MKQKAVFLLLAVILLMGLRAECQNQQGNKPMRKVLFVMNEREVLHYDEFIGSNRLQNGKWACFVRDTLNDRITFVWNGVRKDDAGEFVYVDLNDYNQCVQLFYTYDKSYIKTPQGVFGPYHYVSSSMQNDNRFDFESNKFEFRKEPNGETYVHDQDGFVYKLSEGRREFRSPNGKHWAELSSDGYQLTIDGRNYNIPMPWGSQLDRRFPTKLFLFDDGTCYYEVDMRKENTSLEMSLYIADGDVRVLQDYENFDFMAHKVRTKGTMVRRSPSFWETAETSFTQTNNLGQEENWYGFRLKDRTGNHLFVSSWNKDFVMIDGRRYGDTAPFHAFYDFESNAFVWIVCEDNKLVQYSYSLGK